MNWILIEDEKPAEHGYYLAAWDDTGHWRVSELWYNPQSLGSGWWPTRGYMARFVGDTATSMGKRSLTVIAWMHMPEYPGLSKIIGYRIGAMTWDPSNVTIIREQD